MSKSIIVTGASRGIGLAIAKHLVQQSHRVIAVATNQDLLDRLQAEDSRNIRTLAGDLRDSFVAKNAVGLAIREYGGLDGLVINHGAMFNVSKIADCDVEDWKQIFDINFFSALVLVKLALPALRESKGPAIVMTSSGAATGAYSTWGAYTASKAALNTLARQIACEEPDVKAFAIRPGVVDTDMQRDVRNLHSTFMAEKDNAKFREAYEKETILQPEQPGSVMAKLVVDPDPLLNGQFLSWDSKELSRYR